MLNLSCACFGLQCSPSVCGRGDRGAIVEGQSELRERRKVWSAVMVAMRPQEAVATATVLAYTLTTEHKFTKGRKSTLVATGANMMHPDVCWGTQRSCAKPLDGANNNGRKQDSLQSSNPLYRLRTPVRTMNPSPTSQSYYIHI